MTIQCLPMVYLLLLLGIGSLSKPTLPSPEHRPGLAVQRQSSLWMMAQLDQLNACNVHVLKADRDDC